MPNVFNQGTAARPQQNAFVAPPALQAEPPIGRVTGQDAGGGLWVQTPDGQEIALPADRINVRDGMAYALPPQEVGLGGKVLGTLGLDLDGDRGRTSWGEAAHNSTKARGGRGNVLPIDESGLAVPGMLAQPIEDFNAMSPQNSVEENSRLSFSASGLAPIGSAVNGAVSKAAQSDFNIMNSFSPEDGLRRSVTRNSAVPEDPDAMRSTLPHYTQPEAQSGAPFTATMYHGSVKPRDYSDGLWASSSPQEAATFARNGYAPGVEPWEGGRVAPVQVDLQNPYVIDAHGAGSWEIPLPDKSGRKVGTSEVVEYVQNKYPNHDGVVFRNTLDTTADTPLTQIKAIKPGTVRSATTGDLLYSNSPTGASVPLLQRLLGQRGGQAATADAGAIQAEMAQLQQRHAELFGQPYRTPQPPGGATPETMAADLADLKSRIVSRETQNASQPVGPSVPQAGAPRLPAVPPNPNVAKRVAEFGEIQDQVASNPFVQTRNEKGQFVKKAEEKRLINDYYSRKGEPLTEGPWGREKTQYQDVAKAQQQFEAARRDIVTNNQAIQKAEQQRTAAVRGAKPNAVRQKDAEIKQLKAENEQLRSLYERLSKIIKPQDE